MMCGISSCVVSQLHMLSPVTLLLGGQGYGMELVTQVSITWLRLKWLVAALVLEAEWKSGLGDPTGPDHMELWHCTRVG